VTRRTEDDLYRDPYDRGSRGSDFTRSLDRDHDQIRDDDRRRDSDKSKKPGPTKPGTGLTDITVSSHSVTVTVWDHRKVDGDKIAILLNNKPVVPVVLLTKDPQSFKIKLNKGKNSFGVKALNMGTDPPNTASVRFSNVTAGDDLQVYVVRQTGVSADMNINAPGQ
jgi:hypothetical protein